MSLWPASPQWGHDAGHRSPVLPEAMSHIIALLVTLLAALTLSFCPAAPANDLYQLYLLQERVREAKESGRLDIVRDTCEEGLRLSEQAGLVEPQAVFAFHLGAAYDEIAQTGGTRDDAPVAIDVVQDQDALERAVDAYRVAVAGFRSIGNRLGEAASLNRLGVDLDAGGQTDQAMDPLERALLICRVEGEREMEMGVLLDLASALEGAGRLDDALAKYHRAVSLAERLRQSEAQTVARIGLTRVYRALGRYAEAFGHGEAALRLMHGNTLAEAMVIPEVAALLARLDRHEEALRLLRKAERYLRDLDRPALLASVLTRIGESLIVGGRVDEAVAAWQEARDLARSADADALEAGALDHLAKAASDRGQFHDALRDYALALEHYRRGGYLRGVAGVLGRIAIVEHRLGRAADALHHAEDALEMEQHLWTEDRVETLITLGALYEQLEQHADAVAPLERALELADRLDNPELHRMVLARLGSVRNGTHRYAVAMRLYRQALEMARASDDALGQAQVLQGIGRAYAGLGRDRLALEHYKAALELYTGEGDRLGQGNCHGNIALVLMDQYRFDEARVQLENALRLHEAAASPAYIAFSLFNLATLYERQGRLEQALGYMREVVARRREAQLPLDLAKALRRLGELLSDSGHPEAGLDALDEAHTRFTEQSSLLGAASVELARGRILMASARFDEALRRLESALTAYRDAGDLEAQAEVLASQATILVQLGLTNRALALYGESAATAPANAETSAIADCNSGLIKAEQGDRDEALRLAQRCVAVLRDLGNLANTAKALALLARLDHERGEQASAEAQFAEALGLWRQTGDRLGEASLQQAIGEIRVGEGRLDDAFAAIGPALALQLVLAGDASVGEGWHALAELLQAQGGRSAAILAGKLAVAGMQSVRGVNRELDEYMRLGLRKSYRAVYRQLAELLLAAGRTAEAQQVLDLLQKARFYDYLLSDERGPMHRPTSVLLTGAERAWADRLEIMLATAGTLRDELLALDGIHPDARTRVETARHEALSEELDGLVEHLVRLLEGLRDGLPGPEADEDRPTAAVDLVARLTREAGGVVALLQYLIADQRLFVLVTTPHSRQVRAVEIEAATLDEEILALTTALGPARSEAEPPARQLYGRLIAPVADILEADAVQHLVIQPDGRLSYIPFAALHDGEDWLVARFTTAIHSPAVTDARAPKRDAWSVTGFGATRFPDPDADVLAAQGPLAAVCRRTRKELPNVAWELDQIVREPTGDDRGVLPGHVLIDRAFTRRALLDSPNTQRPVLHIASHFVLDRTSAVASCLQLGGGGLISLRELRTSGLDLRHLELVTLSSCETGLAGTDGEGLEIDALATVFLRQGAEAVVASLWSVADASTGQLMYSLYDHMNASGATKAQALRTAQLELLGGAGSGCGTARGIQIGENDEPTGCSAYSHPFFWAPFFVVGNWL